MEVFSNNAQSTLDGSIDNAVTSLDVQSATLFPTTGNFRIRIDDEIMLVTGVSADTFTVDRAEEGTAAASHTNGAVVRHVLTAEALETAIYESRGWTEIIKTADEDVSNATTGTTLQDDDHLVTPNLVSGETYEFEAILNVRNPVSTGGNFKFTFAEDNTTRGIITAIGTNTGGTAATSVFHSSTAATAAFITVSTEQKLIMVRGTFISNGGAFKLQWAQNTASANVVRLYAGSYMRYRQVT